MFENQWEALADLYIAKEEDYQDWNKHVTCLCSRVLVKSSNWTDSAPRKVQGKLKTINIFDQFSEICSLDSFPKKERITSESFKSKIEYDNQVIRKQILIQELDCNITLFLIPKSHFNFEIGADKSNPQYTEVILDDELLDEFYIFFKKTTGYEDAGILKDILKLFILNCENLNSNNSFLSNGVQEPLKCEIISSKNYYQLNPIDILKYHKILNHCRSFDQLMNISLASLKFEDFWSQNGETTVWLTWIHKYRDHIDSGQMKSNFEQINSICVSSKTSEFIKNLIENQKFQEKKKVNSNYQEPVDEACLNCPESGMVSVSNVEIDSQNFGDNSSELLSTDETWQHLWETHCYQQYETCLKWYHYYQSGRDNILFKIYTLLKFTRTEQSHSTSSKHHSKKILERCVNICLEILRKEFENHLAQELTKSINQGDFIGTACSNSLVADNSHSADNFYNSTLADSDKVLRALRYIGFAYEHNIKDCSYKAEIYYRHKNVKCLTKSPKLKPLPITPLMSDSSITMEEQINNEEIDNNDDEDDVEDKDNDSQPNEGNKKRNRKRRKKFKSSLPSHVQENPELKKYWAKRYRLFSKFDEGIKLDHESWFSVTPEKIAKHLAERCRCDLLIDAFCGAGGNSIQFAFTCERIYAIDIDPEKIAIAQHNAKVYGVEDRIEFIIGDFFCIAERLFGDVVFLSPPWGGPSYIQDKVFDMENVMFPHGGTKLLEVSRQISQNVAYYLPKNINTLQLAVAAGPGSKVELEQNYLGQQLVAVTAYFGELTK